MNEGRIDFDLPYEEVIGFGFTDYRYTQDGMFFNTAGVRVNEDGSFFTRVDSEAEDQLKALEEAAKSDKQAAAVVNAVKKGFQLPARMLNGGLK